MATLYAEVEVWVLVDEDGNYAVGAEVGLAREDYEQRVGELDGERGLRWAKLAVRVPIPAVIELSGEVSVCEEGTGLVVK